VIFFLEACSGAAQSSKSQGSSDVAATVGPARITLGEVDEKAMQKPAHEFGGVKLLQAVYEARRSVLDEMIDSRLLDEEARARGLDRSTLVAREITAKVPVPTDEEITSWYHANSARIQEGGSLDQLRGAIKTYLTNERTTALRQQFIETLKAKTPVRIYLEIPRQKVETAGRPAQGPPNAPIEIVEFSDFQCPFCLAAHPTVTRVLATYGNRIHFVYRNYPLPNHPNARPAAEAAACANAQGKFWPYHDKLFDNQSRLTDADLKQHAASVGLDRAAFNACFDARTFRNDIDDDIAAGAAVGVSGTPSFFINGRQVDGSQPYENFKRVIDEELASKKS
jgi:protein-disulfide isomerase